MSRVRTRNAVVAVAAMAATVGIVFGVISTQGDAEVARTARLWSWHGKVPGTPVTLDAVGRAAVSESVADAATVREVVRAPGADGGLTLLAAAGPNGSECLTIKTDAMSRQFTCADAAALDQRMGALDEFHFFGGSSPGVVDRAAIVGIARADVASVKVELASGSDRSLPLNRWHGFRYAAAAADQLPTHLVAYDATGRELKTIDFDLTPLEQP
jgi:hypothetical protein